MSINRGKKFEDQVREDLERTGAYVLRLYDPQGGYVGVANPCDFVVHRKGVTYMIECKAIHGNLLSINSNDPKKKYGQVSNTQWEGLLEASEHGLVAGLLVWWIDKDVTKFIPIQTANMLKAEGAKSIKYVISGGGVQTVQGRKKRVFFEYDFDRLFTDLFGF